MASVRRCHSHKLSYISLMRAGLLACNRIALFMLETNSVCGRLGSARFIFQSLRISDPSYQ